MGGHTYSAVDTVTTTPGLGCSYLIGRMRNIDDDTLRLHSPYHFPT